MMSENAQTPPPAATPVAAPAPAAVPARSVWPALAISLAVLAVLLAAGQWLDSRSRLDAALAASQEARGAQKEVREQFEALQSRLGVLEGRLTEFQGQGAALQGLYQEIAHNREDATLLEVEQAITLASQQLQLAGNVPVAVLALQTADLRLTRLDAARYLPLRKALAKDLAQLNGLVIADLPGISLRLEQAVLAADKLPLVGYGRPVVKAENAEPVTAQPWWQRALHAARQEFGDLVRIQRFDRVEPVLLAPGQEFFLRENLKLRLLNARLALLARDAATFRSELGVAQAWLARHFDADDKVVQATQASLRQMAGSELNATLPDLGGSLSAVRSLRGGKEKR